MGHVSAVLLGCVLLASAQQRDSYDEDAPSTVYLTSSRTDLPFTGLLGAYVRQQQPRKPQWYFKANDENAALASPVYLKADEESVALWYADSAWNFGCVARRASCVRMRANFSEPTWPHQLEFWEWWDVFASSWVAISEVRCLAGGPGEAAWGELVERLDPMGLEHAAAEVVLVGDPPRGLQRESLGAYKRTDEIMNGRHTYVQWPTKGMRSDGPSLQLWYSDSGWVVTSADVARVGTLPPAALRLISTHTALLPEAADGWLITVPVSRADSSSRTRGKDGVERPVLLRSTLRCLAGKAGNKALTQMRSAEGRAIGSAASPIYLAGRMPESARALLESFGVYEKDEGEELVNGRHAYGKRGSSGAT
jgi:hypothetical protein